MDTFGTAHGIVGVSEILRPNLPQPKIIAVEPAELPVVSKGYSGAHRIEGIGAGFIPPAWRPELVDDVCAIRSEETHDCARRLAAEEGIFAGASTGAAVSAALQVAAELGDGKTVLALAPDLGIK